MTECQHTLQWHQIGNIVLNVMKCLDAKDICVASQVCGLWCDIGTLDEIWKPVYMKQFLLPPPTVCCARVFLDGLNAHCKKR
ncbi:hypothetical protein SARC_05984, partial [Sphaeroforma arctica JP610]